MSRSTYVFDESVDLKLRCLAAKSCTNKTEVLKRAIALYDFIESRRKPGSNGVTLHFGPDDAVEVVMP